MNFLGGRDEPDYGRPATADIVAVDDVEVMRGRIQDPKPLRERGPVLSTRILFVICRDLVVSIQHSVPQPGGAKGPDPGLHFG